MAWTAYAGKPWLQHYEGVSPNVEVPERSLVEVFDEVTGRFAGQTAIIFYGNRIRYRELRDQVDRLATALVDLGVEPGDRVALYLLNSPQFVIAYFAALKAGATITPISPVYTSGEVRHQLADSGARSVICQDILYENVARTGLELDRIIVTAIDEYLPPVARLLGKSVMRSAFQGMAAPRGSITGLLRFSELLARYPAHAPEVKVDPARALASLPYTGGTTAAPKGVMLTHQNLLACHTEVFAHYSFLEEGKETGLAFLPFYHIYGQVVVMLGTLFTGSTMVLFTTPDMDQVLYALEKYRATTFYGVPTLYEFLKEYERTGRVDWKRLKVITCGADTLHEATVKDWERRTGSRILEGYGMTETSGVSHVNPPGRPKTGSFGVPLPNMTAGVVDPESNAFLDVGETGELVVAGPNIMRGYWNRPEETRATLVEMEGLTWLKTGDLCSMDEEGYFHFYDRKKDLIKHRGYSVFPREIEEILYQHPQVKAVGVIGVPDPRVGQTIKAHIVLQPEARGKVTPEEMIEFCRGKLAHYKVPRVVEFRGELPKTDVGKISRRELREELE
ncbi:MAG: long-chain fatty acid--CoA ligase [bacterium]|nr:long-chain fatty acid--CoA ligase [bacterium]